MENYPSIPLIEGEAGRPTLYVLADEQGHILLEAASSNALEVDITSVIRRFAETDLDSLIAEVDGVVIRLERRDGYIVATTYLDDLDEWYAFASRLIPSTNVYNEGSISSKVLGLITGIVAH